MPPPRSALSATDLAAALGAARAGLDALADTLSDDDWIGPFGDTFNPPLWEYGHIVWFQEHWCLRQKPGRRADESPLTAPLEPSGMAWSDWRYDSSRIPHAARWHLPLPTPEQTRAWGRQVLEAVQDKLARGDDDASFAYFCELALHHESMHSEAWWMMWQARCLAPPRIPDLPRLDAAPALRSPAASVTLGGTPDTGFVFDNEKWAHEVALEAFEIDAQPVTNAQYAAFIDSDDAAPAHWRRAGQNWELRRFDRWIALPPDEPVFHVTRPQALAYASARKRRLPSAAEWQHASALPGFTLGRCWEWTADAFAPYPGFEPDPYADYSLPWFDGKHVELRGAGSWVTDARLARPTLRNFYTPGRSDVFVGFRTARDA